MVDLPCDSDGMCMVCKKVPLDEHVLLCSSCTSPWHMQCLKPPMSSVPLGDWDCPDCNMPPAPPTSASHDIPAMPIPKPGAAGSDNDVVGKIRAIQADDSLSEEQKARKRQELMACRGPSQSGKTEAKSRQGKGKRNETLEMLDQNLNCIFCMQLAERPVTTPCGHNFCLKCFQRWIGQGKKSCGKCRAPIPSQMANQPRINSALVMAIRLAKAAATSVGTQGPPRPYHHIDNEKRPDKCFTSERAVKTGKANACSGRIFVTIAPDHFGPILAENDPLRSQGVLVGESWEDRMECRQWGAHFPHVAGIAGQSDYGAQSVALSGGYEDDEDHGEWFLYTGSGGRDLSGNKRTNKEQSFDQKFDKSNEALRVSCKRGYPVRVVRSHKEKRSSYAPEKGVRYDGVYRIEKCWRKKGIQGHRVCRYLFVRCDNEPAPWTSDDHGDRPRSLPTIGELKDATDVFERKSQPAWDWKEDSGVWGWTRDPPESRKNGGGGQNEKSSKRKHLTIQQRLLKEFGCSLCRKVMELPLSTPCGHNFCKACLVAVFSGQQDIRERTGVGGRSLRVQKVMKRCPTCKGDITDFVTCPQVNRQLEDLIQSLKTSIADDGDYEDEHNENALRQASIADHHDDGEEEEEDKKAVKRVKTAEIAGKGREDNSKDLDDETDRIVKGNVIYKTWSKDCDELHSGRSPNVANNGGKCREVALVSHQQVSVEPLKVESVSLIKVIPKRHAQKARPLDVVKDTDDESSDDGTSDDDTSEFESSKLKGSHCHQVVSGTKTKVSINGKKSNGNGHHIVLDSEDEADLLDTPRLRYTRSQHIAAVAEVRKKRKSYGGGSAEIIEL